MNIKWKEVKWHPRLLLIILLLGVVAVLSFYVSAQYALVAMSSSAISPANQSSNLSTNTPIIGSIETTFTAISTPKNIVHKDDSSTTAVNRDFKTYQGTGYSISIPSDLIYSSPRGNYDTWHSSDNSEAIIIQWEPDSPNAPLRRNAISGSTQPLPPTTVVSHPIINGASAPGILIDNPMYIDGAFSANDYSATLSVAGENGNFYEILGLSTTPAARASVEEILMSFSIPNM